MDLPTEWTCSRCTLSNAMHLDLCGVCEFAKPKHLKIFEAKPPGSFTVKHFSCGCGESFASKDDLSVHHIIDEVIMAFISLCCLNGVKYSHMMVQFSLQAHVLVTAL